MPKLSMIYVDHISCVFKLGYLFVTLNLYTRNWKKKKIQLYLKIKEKANPFKDFFPNGIIQEFLDL